MVTRAEYAKAKAAVENAYTKESIADYSKAYNEAKSQWATTKDALSKSTGLLVKNQVNSWWWSTNTTATWGTSSWASTSGDIYGDVNKTPTTTNSMDFSSYTWNKKLAESDAIFGENAKIKEKNESWFLTRRNDSIASELFNLWTVEDKDVEDYLMKFKDFQNASPEDQANTKRAISDRLSEKRKANWDTTITDTTTTVDANGNKITDTTTTETNPSKDGYYFDKGTGEYVKIYWYDDLSKDYRDLIDRMDEQERKYLSNMWAAGMQKQVKTYLDAMRSKDQAEAMQEKNQELYDINRAKSLIDAQQTLRHSQEQYDNLKQNWQYLGNMWMPWTSATKIQAIGDSLKEAQTTLWEIQKLTQLKLDAQEKQWEAQVLQYNQQIDNLMYNLNWQVGSEVQAALSKFTTAELEWQLDTIDGITAFRKELLDELDANISWLTSASLDQMQYITKEYQDIADKMYEYQQNAQKVNQDMSAVKGYYIDGNGNPILNSKWETIEVPQNPPLDPVFDKDTGKLIVFWYDENGNIVANVQQLWDNPSDSASSRIIQLLNNWYSVSDILKIYPDLDPEKVQNLAKIIEPSYNKYWLPTTWQWANYNAVDEGKVLFGMANFAKSHPVDSNGWSCGHFVNDYLQQIGVGRIFGDSVEQKASQVNSLVPSIWSVIIMDSPTAKENWHVGIITSYNEETWEMTILQSNKSKSDPNKVFIWTKNVNDWDIYGYFNPSISIDDYNSMASASAWGWKSTGQWAAILDTLDVSDDNTATQNAAYWFAKRTWQADELIRELESKFSGWWNIDSWDWLKSQDHKKYETAKNEWITAFLRKDSWAAISDEEFDRVEQYFPKVWDSKETIEYKQKLRENVMEGLFSQAGKASNGQSYINIYRNNRKTDNYATNYADNYWTTTSWWWDSWTQNSGGWFFGWLSNEYLSGAWSTAEMPNGWFDPTWIR